MKFLKRWVKRYQNFVQSIQRTVKRNVRLLKLRINEFIKAVQLFFIALWNRFVVIPCKFIKKWWDKLFWRHVVRLCRWISRKTSFFRWKSFVSQTSDSEKERYALFIEILGGWKNVVAFRCRTKSWHLKIIHSFLIDWEKFPHFGIKVTYWEWPYLNLAIGSYSKWIFKRLKKITNMPFKLRKSRKKF